MTNHLPPDRLTAQEAGALEWLEGDCPEPSRAHHLYPDFDHEGGAMTVQFVNACLRARVEQSERIANQTMPAPIRIAETVEMPLPPNSIPPWLRY